MIEHKISRCVDSLGTVLFRWRCRDCGRVGAWLEQLAVVEANFKIHLTHNHRKAVVS